MSTLALNRKPRGAWLKGRTIAIGLAVTLLGALGLWSTFATRAEQGTLEAKILAQYDGAALAPLPARVTPNAPAAQPNPDGTGQAAAPAAGSDTSAGTVPGNPNQALSMLGYVPDRIQIPAIGLDAPIIAADAVTVELKGKTYSQLLVPRGSRTIAGWYPTSALLGTGGNTVIAGHHNVYGKVFEKLIKVNEGDLVILSSGDTQFEYYVTTKVIFEERFVSLQTRLANAAWVGPTEDERLTLVTCWPMTSDTHRLVVVARPYTPRADDLGTRAP